jgi:hypothetical protein
VGGCATGGQWASSGTGTFMPDDTTLNALYCPSAADMAGGGVTLTLTSTGPCAPCPAATAQVVETLIPPPVPPLISSFGGLSDGSFSLGGTGAVGQICILLGASNLASPMAWTPIATNTADINGAFSLSDPEATNFQQRFYRIWTP